MVLSWCFVSQALVTKVPPRYASQPSLQVSLPNDKMSSLLGEPFLLANYPIPSQNSPQSSGTSKIRGNRNVLVKGSCSTHGEGYATVTVQGDGIHILEVLIVCIICRVVMALNLDTAIQHACDCITHFRSLCFFCDSCSYTAQWDRCQHFLCCHADSARWD